jgi:hypothetical protein
VHETVVKVKKQNPKLREFIEKAERVHSKGEDLETSLIRIVQRIPQYNMILSVWDSIFFLVCLFAPFVL